jgi:seryl-tRNA synthetase
MLDIQDFIKERGGDPEKIRESQRKRHANVDLIDEVIAQFEDHKKTQYEATQIASKINEIQKKIGQKKKAKENADDLLKEKDELTKKRKAQEDLAAEKLDNLQKKVKLVGNYVHPSVPVSGTEDDNALIREWSPEKGKLAGDKLMSHHEVLYRIGGYDPDAGVKIVGHRGYCLIGVGFWLSRMFDKLWIIPSIGTDCKAEALIQYAMRFLHKRSYVPNQTPFMMNKDDMAKTAQLEQFDEELVSSTP